LKATMRRQRNLIEKILVQGKEVTDVGDVKRFIIRYFKNLYRKQKCTRFDISDLGLQKLSQEEVAELERPVTRQEIDDAIGKCDPSKAPGYDGFNLKCIKKMWPIIGEDFYAYIYNFFETGSFHESFNTTWVTLSQRRRVPWESLISDPLV